MPTPPSSGAGQSWMGSAWHIPYRMKSADPVQGWEYTNFSRAKSCFAILSSWVREMPSTAPVCRSLCANSSRAPHLHIAFKLPWFPLHTTVQLVRARIEIQSENDHSLTPHHASGMHTRANACLPALSALLFTLISKTGRWSPTDMTITGTECACSLWRAMSSMMSCLTMPTGHTVTLRGKEGTSITSKRYW